MLCTEYVYGKQIDYFVDLNLDRWESLPCGEPPAARFELLITIGRPLLYFSEARSTFSC